MKGGKAVDKKDIKTGKVCSADYIIDFQGKVT